MNLDRFKNFNSVNFGYDKDYDLLNNSLLEELESDIQQIGDMVDIEKLDYSIQQDKSVMFLEQTKLLNKATEFRDRQCYFNPVDIDLSTGDIVSVLDVKNVTDINRPYKRKYLAVGLVEDDVSVNYVRVQEINHTLKWYDKRTGKLVEQECILQVNVKTEGDYSFGKYAWEGDKEYRAILPNNLSTKMLNRGYEFIIDNLVYKITAYDRVASPNKGLLTLRLREVLSDYQDDMNNKVKNIDLDITLDVEPFEVNLNTTYTPKIKLFKDGREISGGIYDEFLIEEINTVPILDIQSGVITGNTLGNTKVKFTWKNNENVNETLDIEVIPSTENPDVKTFAIEGDNNAYMEFDNKYVLMAYINGKKIDVKALSDPYELKCQNPNVIIKEDSIVIPKVSLLGQYIDLEMVDGKTSNIVATKKVLVTSF